MSEDVDVLIVGAGPVGLSLAIELGHRGVSCHVVERHDRVGTSPRAKTTNVRTREHLRRWGIAEELRRVSPMPRDYPPDIVFATRMSGPLLFRFEGVLNAELARNDLYSESAQWVPQYVLEEVLRAHAVSLAPVHVSFDTTLEALAEDAEGVTATVMHAGAARALRGRYVVGADGARSTVRRLIGARLEGDGASSANLNLVFRSRKLAAMHGHGRAIMYWMVNEEVPAVLGPMSDDGLWYFIATKLPEGVDPARMDWADLVRRATGIDCDIEIVSTDPWVALRLVADSYGRGRVYLAGDACHLHPPFGGFGMNMGIGDAVDLGWKLAARLRGWGGQALLASYEAERRPVHEWGIAEAVANYATVGNQLARTGLEREGPLGEATRREVGDIVAHAKAREFFSLGTVKGYTYSGSDIVVPDGTRPPVRQGMVYEPSAHPGCVAPHLWLADGSSLYDHFGPGFTLLVAGPDEVDAAVLVARARGLGLPLTIARPGDDRLAARYGAALALIRPDQHVAWRGDALPDDIAGLLDKIRGEKR